MNKKENSQNKNNDNEFIDNDNDNIDIDNSVKDSENMDNASIDRSYDYQTDEFLNDVSKSLRTQVIEELNKEGNTFDRPEQGKKDNWRKFARYFLIPIALLVIVAFVMTKTDFGKSLIVRIISNYSYGKLDYVDSDQDDINLDNKEQTQPENAVEENMDENAQENTEVFQSQFISNILLIGVETFDGAENTDTMIVASVDTKNNVIKLTSLMRDLYVKIPGYNNAKLNSVYAKGGMNLLYDTIRTNFNIDMKGYVLVDFNDFEQIIDYLGGIDIKLTKSEAQYLRTTNYISKPQYRDVVAGTQHMNGNQVLGYCRIRKVSTATESSDFGRTQRQRIVLEKIFEKLRSKNIIQLGFIMNNILSNIDIKTDITKAAYNEYLQQAVYLEKNAIKTFRIPSDDNYTNESYNTGKYNKDVLVPKSWEDTRRELYDFIYGDLTDE